MFRVLNILDDSNREAVAQEISMSMPAERVISILEKVIFIKGKPECIWTDNGPEFISEKMRMWCEANRITSSSSLASLRRTVMWNASTAAIGGLYLMRISSGISKKCVI